jgi:TolB-like protein/cytochrome c-type biogenesis protein CcmH/NrfG
MNGEPKKWYQTLPAIITTWVGAFGAIAGLLVTLYHLGVFSWPSPSPMPTIREKGIAVLPFDNLSDEKANAYFAEGIQDEILTRLSKIAALTVISRTSTRRYQSAPDNLREVGRQLGVAHVLEGSVQRVGNRVRVNAQLIDARTDAHEWAEKYDRPLNDVFTIQSDIAQTIADQLNAKLSPSEQAAIAQAPTQNVVAYNLFLKAEHEFYQGENAQTAQPLTPAVELYQQAIDRDPEFALAHARLAWTRLWEHWFVKPLTAPELDGIKSHIDRALALDPKSPEAHLALGVYHYWGYRNYEPALIEFRRALELQPNNALACSLLGYVYRRQGQWEESLAEIKRAEELAPLDVNFPTERGLIHINLRQWNEARQAITRALEIKPDHALAIAFRVQICVNGTGDIKCARRAVESVPNIKINTSSNLRYDATAFIGERCYVDVFERNFSRALQAWDKPLDDTSSGRIWQLEARVAIQMIAGQPAAARSEAEQLRSVLESSLTEQPKDAASMVGLSWAYACLGRNVDALENARRASKVLPVEKDALSGSHVLVGLAEVAAHTGQPKQAIEILRRLASIPAGQVCSVSRLKIDPVWDPIRNLPDFQKLLSGPEQVGPNK